jgi:aldehyde dehydrogenase (NAD(P)+)
LLTEGRPSLRAVGGGEGALPWTLVTGLDAESRDPAFTTEPFCSILSETQVGSTDPLEYLDKAVTFVNERVWGTLAAHVVVHRRTLSDATLREALLRAIARLRYGTVAVNCWAGYGYAFGTTPWGGHPSASLTDIQSGRGFVHNTLMLERVEKTVVWHPTTTFPKPPYVPSHRTAHRLGERLTRLEAKGSWTRVPAVVGAAVRA